MNFSRKHIGFTGLVIISGFLLTSCESYNYHLGPNVGIRIPIEEMTKEQIGSESDKTKTEDRLMFSQLDNSDDIKTDIKTTKSKEYIGSGKFFSKKSKKILPKNHADGKYSMNFDAADISEVIKIILSDMLHENYVLSPKVAGTVTLQTTQPLHKQELLPTLEMLLRVNNAVLIKQDGIYRIEPGSTALKIANTSLLDSKKIHPGYQIKVIPLKYVGAIDMAEIIKPVVPNNAIIKIDPARNILLVAGTRSELEKIVDLINTFDVNYIAGMSFGLYPLENIEVGNAIADIEKIINKGEKSPLSGVLRLIAIKHLNAILVISQQKYYLQEIEKWIKRLDIQQNGIDEGGFVVYRVQHVDAVELAATLNSIIRGISSSSKRPPSVAPGQRVATISNKTTKVNNSSQNKANNFNMHLKGVNIIADEPNNSLIIMAQLQQYRILNKIIKKLDVMPLQVLIDATIVSVSLTDGFEHGVQWVFNNGLGGNYKGTGLLSSVGNAIAAASTGGFSYGVLNNGNQIRLLFNTLAKNNKLNVLSTPSVMVLNNRKATIKVGDQVPIRTAEATNTNSSLDPIQTSSIEMRDTGVILTVKPRVNANGVVILEIDQKVDEVGKQAASGSNIDSPTIIQRQIKSTVAVISGESIVLGGLMKESHTYSNNGIPVLKDIPYIGWLFGKQEKTVIKDELIAIITPRVVENKFDARKVTNEFKRKLSGIYYDKNDYNLDQTGVLRNYSGHEIKIREGAR